MNDLAFTVAQVYEALKTDFIPAQDAPTMVTVIETNSIWDDNGNLVRVLTMERAPLLVGKCGDAPIYRFDDEPF